MKKNNIIPETEVKVTENEAMSNSGMESFESESIINTVDNSSEYDNLKPGNVELNPIVEEVSILEDGDYTGTIVAAFCYNRALGKAMLKIDIGNETVFINPVTIAQLSKRPYVELRKEIGAKYIGDLEGVDVKFTVGYKEGYNFSFIKEIQKI